MSNNAQQSATISSLAIFLGVTTAVLWALWPVLSRYSILQSLDALDIAVLRFWVAGSIMLPYLLKHGFGGLSFGAILFFSVTAGVGYVSFALTGLEYASAIYAGMVTPSSTMVFTALGGWLVFGDRPTGQRLAGMVLIVVGILITGLTATPTGDDPLLWLGLFLFALAGFFWGSFSVGTQKYELSALHIAAIVSVGAMLIVTPPYVLFKMVLGDGGVLNAPLEEIVFQGVFQGIVTAIIALFTYAKTVKLLGSARGSLFVALVPGLTPVLAYLILGEQLNYIDVVSLMLITLGMVIAIRARQ